MIDFGDLTVKELSPGGELLRVYGGEGSGALKGQIELTVPPYRVADRGSHRD